MDDDDWAYFGAPLWAGPVHDLRDAEGPPPRLYGMRSVSKAACWALHKEPKVKRRRAGFVIRRK